MSDWQSLSKSQERFVRWKGQDEVVLWRDDGGMVKVSKASLMDANKAALLDLMRASGSELGNLGNLRVTVGDGFLRLHASTDAGQEWVGFAAIAVIDTADP